MSKAKYKPVAVIMCIYRNDRANFLKEAIDSVIHQEGICSHVYVFVDGPISEPLLDCLELYSSNRNFVVHFSEVNVGLASGLNWLIDNYVDFDRYDYVARMDADDISCASRFIKQVELLDTSEISVVGSDCIEIDQDGSEIFYKRMPSEDLDIKNNIVKRCPFVHPSVMFSTSVLKAGYRYNPSLMNTQDYYLWVELASNGIKFANINEPLIRFRMDDNFHSRRGLKKLSNELQGRFFAMKKLNVFTVKNLIYTLAFSVLRILPESMSKLAYKYFR